MESFASDCHTGLIPGPQETDKDFFERASRAKKKFEEGAWISPVYWTWAKERLWELAQVRPDYVCAFYSNKGLRPWQGAATWIEGTEVHSVQLREKAWLTDRDELLAHEAVHAIRCAFNSKYDEFFAYQTSPKKWRRVLGPIVRRPWEVWPLFLGLIHPLFALAWVMIGMIRLMQGHRTLKKAYDRILKEVANPARARAILFRLSDEEIENILPKEDNLRWQIIKGFYGTEDRR